MNSQKKTSFGQKMEQLQELTAWFESDAADLESGIDKFEVGMKLVAELKTDLARLENRVEKVKHNFANPPEQVVDTAISQPLPGQDNAGLFDL